MKKIIFVLLVSLISVSGFSQVALYSAQTVQITRADTANARLLRIANNTGTTSGTTLNLDSVKNFLSGRQSGFHLTYASGSLTAGIYTLTNVKSVCFQTSSDFTGSINGVARSANSTICVNANTGGMLTDINITVSTGTVIYDRIYKP